MSRSIDYTYNTAMALKLSKIRRMNITRKQSEYEASTWNWLQVRENESKDRHVVFLSSEIIL